MYRTYLQFYINSINSWFINYYYNSNNIKNATKIQNKSRNIVREHFYCVKNIFDLHKSREQLDTLAKRPDLDIVCAFDYQRMKEFALNGNGLKYANYNPEAQGIKVSKLD